MRDKSYSSQDLDRYITGNYGEDQHKEEPDYDPSEDDKGYSQEYEEEKDH